MDGKALFFVIAQFALLATLLGTGPWIPSAPGWLVLGVGGLGLGLWSLATMRHSRLNVAPTVRKGATLITEGPYRWIRHPMYTALLLVTGAWVGDAFSLLRLALWGALLLVLLGKLQYEEALLEAHFPTYVSYRAQSWRLVPYVF